MKQRKNILITGASGFVGQRLANRLLRDNQNIFLVSLRKEFKFPGVKVYYGDLADTNFCNHILQGIDLVYYLAGYKKNVGYHVAKPFEFLSGNVAPMLSFLSAAKSSQLKKIIYLSSVLADCAAGEENIDGYVLGKHINELILRSFAVEHRRIKTKIIRSAPIYGPGDHFEQETANFIPTMVGRIFKEKDKVVAWGTGKRKLQFIYIDDLVNNIVAATNHHGNFFVFGNPETVSVEDVVFKIAKLFNKDGYLTFRFDSSKPDKPTKIFNFTNLVRPTFGIDEGLKETVAFYRRSI